MKQAALYPMRSAIVAAVLSFALSAPVLAAEGVGRVLAASGNVTASTPGGGTRVLGNDSRVYQGEVIETREGRVQIRFIDDGLVTLDPGSRFEIEQYEQREEAAGDPDDGGSIFMSLFRGALRTITGAIGDGEQETYNLETPVATVGIRGTQYSLEMCTDGSCGQDVDDGLYGHIGDGRVIVRNEGGDQIFESGSFFRVSALDQQPQRVLVPPGFVLNGALRDALAEFEQLEGNEQIAGSLYAALQDRGLLDGSGIPGFSTSENTGAGEVDPRSGIDVTDLPGAAVAAGFIGNGISDGWACTSGVDCTAGIDGDGNLASTSDGSRTIAAGGDANITSGTDPLIGATWGHWSGEMIVDGAETDGDFLWVYSDQPTLPNDLATAFSGNGTSFVADSGPLPVGSVNGTDWNLASLSVAMTFSSGTALVTAGDVNLTLSGPGLIELESELDILIDPLGNGDVGFQTALIDINSGGDTGDLQARFAGNDGDAMLVQYEARDFDSDAGVVVETIQGVQILKPLLLP